MGKKRKNEGSNEENKEIEDVSPVDKALSRTILMTGLSHLTTAKVIVEFFKDTGRVVDYHFLYQQKSFLSRACVVLFSSTKSARKAVANNANGQILLERPVRVMQSRCTIDSLRETQNDPCVVCIAPFMIESSKKIEEMIFNKIGHYGKIDYVQVKQDGDQCFQGRGASYALVKFEESSSAAKALKEQPMLEKDMYIQLE